MSAGIKMVGAVIVTALLCAMVWLWGGVKPHPARSTLNYSQFIQQLDAGAVAEVHIFAGSSGAAQANVRLKDGAIAQTILPFDYSAALADMQEHTVNVEIEDASTSRARLSMNATPFLILLAVWIYFMTVGRPLLGQR